MNTSPMLAAAKPRTMSCEEFWSVAQKHLPLIVQPKLDGIRCIIDEHGMPRTRTGHAIPNLFIRSELLRLKLPEGLDGELVTYKGTEVNDFNTISSQIRSERGTPSFEYVVFDIVGNDSYTSRSGVLVKTIGKLRESTNSVVGLLSLVATTVEEIQTELNMHLSHGFEGIILRRLDSPYKHGRVTFNEFYLVKVKPMERAEATIVGVENLVTKDSVDLDMLGALTVKSPEWKETFKVGTGFTDAQRLKIWREAYLYLGRRIYFKYQENRSKKDRPIHPVFEGFKHL